MVSTPKTKRGLLIKTDGMMSLVDIPKTGDLKPYYQLIDTDIVERAQAEIEGRVVEIWCDEEGLFKSNAQVNVMLLGLTGRQIVGHVVLHSRSLDKIVEKLRAEGVAIEEVAGE